MLKTREVFERVFYTIKPVLNDSFILATVAIFRSNWSSQKTGVVKDRFFCVYFGNI